MPVPATIRHRLRAAPLPLIALLLGFCAAPAVRAQPMLFGSLDDPDEVHRVARWDRVRYVEPAAGFSLIGAQWRTALGGRLRIEGQVGSLLLDASARAGLYGTYGPDFDQLYDLLRIVRHVRLDPVGRRFTYARLGPLRRTRLGAGHLMDFFSSETAWDDRRVGLELRLGRETAAVYAVTDDVRLGRVVGGRATWNPLAGARSPVLRSLQVGGSYVVDRSTRGRTDMDPVEAWEADLRVEAVRSGAFALRPFVSFARIRRYGDGLLFGADLEADNFIDLASVHARLAVQYAADRFVPGYFGAFYSVSNPRARIVESVDGEIGPGSTVGVALSDVIASTSALTELRIHVFERFEFWYAFRRHYGPQPLSEMHLRMFLRARRFRFGLGQDRGGLGGFFTVFRPLRDEATLWFRTDYRVLRGVWVHAEARYTYERVDRGESPGPRYLVQRRFDPYAGLRVRF